MSSETEKTDEPLVSPRRRGLILFNPKFVRQSNTASQEQSETSSQSAFPKPRKYFDSADFFMREELKNSESRTSPKKSDGEKTRQASALASECQTVGGSESADGMSKNVVPLMLLRRSKSSAMINSSDGLDYEPENLPTTVEALNGPSNREIPSLNSSSGEATPTDSHSSASGSSPTLDGKQIKSPRTREEVRSLLIPRLGKLPPRAHEESSLVTAPSNSPLRTGGDDL